MASSAQPTTPPRWGLTKYALRKRAAERGCEVSQKQFAAYLKWGLIPDPEDGQWPKHVVSRLIEIREAEEKARRLERRAVLLGVQNPDKRRRAMVALAKIMKAPKLKVRRLQRAARKAEEEPPPNVFGNPAYRRVPPPKTWRFPDPAEWSNVLSDKLTLDRFDPVSHAAYWSAQALLPTLAALAGRSRGIPPEEVTLLLTVQELSLHQHAIRETLRRKPKA